MDNKVLFRDPAGSNVAQATIHRLVEQQAVVRSEAFAYLDGRRALTYRELNGRANAMARALIGCGFKRGAVAVARMSPSAELAIGLLAVLKTGGAYKLVDPADTNYPKGFSTAELKGDDPCFRALDVMYVLEGDCPPSPNLPILTRGTDVACVMPSVGGAPEVLVPHATIAALQPNALLDDVEWAGESGALDLWIALMTGATVTVAEAPVETVAA